MKITREELIEHCERQITLNRAYPSQFSKKVILEHRVFIELLRGNSINEVFNWNGEYIEN